MSAHREGAASAHMCVPAHVTYKHGGQIMNSIQIKKARGGGKGQAGGAVLALRRLNWWQGFKQVVALALCDAANRCVAAGRAGGSHRARYTQW